LAARGETQKHVTLGMFGSSFEHGDGTTKEASPAGGAMDADGSAAGRSAPSVLSAVESDPGRTELRPVCGGNVPTILRGGSGAARIGARNLLSATDGGLL